MTTIMKALLQSILTIVTNFKTLKQHRDLSKSSLHSATLLYHGLISCLEYDIMLQ